MARYAVDQRHLAFMRELGIRSVAIVPMRAGERIVGTISLATAMSERVLGEAELELAAELGVRAGIAVANARVHADRSYIATTLQDSLLPPRLPVVPGLTVAARFRAAGEATEVGGDFYDLFEVDGGWMAVIGDVTGKGPVAAALTSLARYTVRTAAMYERSPGALLERLNAVLVTDPDRRRICTAAVVRIEASAPGAGMAVSVACGGHPPPLLLRPGEPARPAGGAGTLLGGFSEGSWPLVDSVLHAGDTLVLYTDGVTDTRGTGDRFGSERLEAVLGPAAVLDADAIAGRLDAALLDYEVGPQRDDVAVLVLRATGRATAAGLRSGRLADAGR
jgi:serine phosphatase RsbU (regulator of sigma subunit)